jgi:hypothetical protein
MHHRRGAGVAFDLARGSSPRWLILADVNKAAEAFLQAATQARRTLTGSERGCALSSLFELRRDLA